MELEPKYNARDLRRTHKILFSPKDETVALIDKEGEKIHTITGDDKSVFDGGPSARELFMEALRVHNTNHRYVRIRREENLEVWEVQ